MADIREYTDLAGKVWYVLCPIFMILYIWGGLKKHYRAIPGGIASFFRKWGYVVVSPVLTPIGRIQEYKAQRAAGTFRGYGYVVFDLSATFIVSLALWMLAVILPLIFLAITYEEMT